MGMRHAAYLKSFMSFLLIPITESHQPEVKDELVTTLAWDAHKYMIYNIYVYIDA